MNKKKEELSGLKTAFFARGWSLAKAGLRAGSLATSQLWNDDPELVKQNLFKTVEAMAREMNQLKGTAMKVGQLLSTYGEHFLPKEANDVLKTLQQNSTPLTWDKIKLRLEEELGPKLETLEVEPVALASASIGQVHRARRLSDGRELALKVQYPGVAGAIETDLKFLKMLFSFSHLVPKGPRFDQIFAEVREMLYQEVDYRNEQVFTQKFHDALKDDPRYIVPMPIPDLSTSKLMTTTFEFGLSPDSPEVQALSLERRNHLGLAFLELYLRELLEFALVQTDPHLGNYKIRIEENGQDRLVLLDFGAVRVVPADFQRNYLLLMRGVLEENAELIERGGRAIGLLQAGDPPALVKAYTDLCLMIGEPFSKNSSENYDWGASDLPKRVAKAGSDLAFGFKLRAPPRELVFLDRKLAGVFVFLSVLKCQLNGRATLEKILSQSKA